VRVLEWLQAGHRVALSRVIEVGGSAPRGLGAPLAMRGDGRIVGSVSAGCVESAVFAALRDVLDGGAPQILTFEAANEPWSVGLSCGGTIRVLGGTGAARSGPPPGYGLPWRLDHTFGGAG